MKREAAGRPNRERGAGAMHRIGASRISIGVHALAVAIGGRFKPRLTDGKTDDFCYNIAENPAPEGAMSTGTVA